MTEGEPELAHGEYDGDLGPPDSMPWDVVPEDIQGEYERLPGQLARALGVYADAAKDVLRLECEVKRVYAEVYLRTKVVLQGRTPKATESVVEATVESTKMYNAACMSLVEAQGRKLKANTEVEALRAKKDMLISLGAHIRAELGGDLSLRERANERPSRKR